MGHRRLRDRALQPHESRLELSAQRTRARGCGNDGEPGELPVLREPRRRLLFAGVNGEPREAFNTRLQPLPASHRSGIPNWRISTVLRGGFGIYYLPQAFFGGGAGLCGRHALTSRHQGGGANQYIPANSLTNPFPSGLLQPTRCQLMGLGTFAGARRPLRQSRTARSRMRTSGLSASSTSCPGV